MKSSGKAFFGSIVMSMILIASIVSLASAGSPVVPMSFWGSLTVDGLPAAIGTNVVAYADGVDKTVDSPHVTTILGMYGYVEVNCVNGELVTFRVNGELADQSIPCDEGAAGIEFPLTVGEPQGECSPGETQPCGTSDIGECSYGTQTCSGEGEWGACIGAVDPVDELCDGLDNDCDGSTDEDFPDLGDPCSSGEGACEVSGEMVCTLDQMGTECSVTAGTGEPEICDGIDNDCDGQTDEDWPELGDVCSVGLGECQDFGFMVCAPTHDGTECDATAGIPSTETCNGLDDDCDGTADNGIAPRSCGVSDLGECSYGVETCDMGDWVGCTAVMPSAEVCTGGLDEDCDGDTDCDDINCVQDPACGETGEFCIEILSIRVLNHDFIEDYYIMPGEMYNVEVVNYNACEDPIESMQIVQVDKIGNTPVNIGTVKSTIAPYSTSTVTVGFVLPGVGIGTDFEANAYNWNHWINQNPSTWEALSEPASVGFEAGTGPA